MKKGQVLNLAKVAVAIALVWYVIHKAGWDNIQQSLSSMDRAQWGLGLGVVFLATVISMLRWHVLMSSVGLNSTPWLALRLGFIGVFFNNVVPGLTGGDLVKAFYVSRENPGYRARAVVSVIVDRIIGIVALALVAAVVIPFDLARFGEAALGIYGFLGAAAVGAVFALSRRAKQKLRNLLARFGRSSEDGKGPSILSRIDEAVSIYRDRLTTIWITLGLSFVVHLLIIVALSIFGGALAQGGLDALPASGLDASASMTRSAELQALGDVTIADYCSIIPIIMIISAVPIAPAGWGVGEVAFVHFFKTVGVVESHAVSLSLTYRITQLLISLLGGVFLLLDRKRVMQAAHEEQPEAVS